MRGLKRSSRLNFKPSIQPVSILVPMRNEQRNIIQLLNSILENNFPLNLFEIVIVDDHSEDDSKRIVLEWKNKNTLVNIIVVSPVGEGKKASIEEGLHNCSNDIILQTDADCVVPENWITSLSSPFQSESINLVAAPVALKGSSVFEKLQAVEFSSLIASSIGLSNMNCHVMANAANLSFRKSVRLNLGLNEKSKSGDDVFLLQNLASIDPDSIVYLSESVVITSAKARLNSFIQQRLRWASKTLEYPDAKSIWVAIFVLMFNLFTLFAILGLFVSPLYASIFLSIRILSDLVLLIKYYGKVLKCKLPIGMFFIQSFINPFYILGIGIGSQFLRMRWKGREM